MLLTRLIYAGMLEACVLNLTKTNWEVMARIWEQYGCCVVVCSEVAGCCCVARIWTRSLSTVLFNNVYNVKQQKMVFLLFDSACLFL